MSNVTALAIAAGSPTRRGPNAISAPRPAVIINANSHDAPAHVPTSTAARTSCQRAPLRSQRITSNALKVTSAPENA